MCFTFETPPPPKNPRVNENSLVMGNIEVMINTRYIYIWDNSVMKLMAKLDRYTTIEIFKLCKDKGWFN